jgi:hypothetical protein
MMGGGIRTGFLERTVSKANGESCRVVQVATDEAAARMSWISVFTGCAQRCAGFGVSAKFKFSFTPV